MPVVVEGIVGLRKALNAYAPALRKEMDKDVRNALKPIIADARSKVPSVSVLNNWNEPNQERKSRTGRASAFPSYNSSIVRRGLTYSLAGKRDSRTGFVSLFNLLNRSAVGAIIETSGRANPSGSDRSQSNNPNAGQQFINAMNQIGTLTDYSNKGKMTTGRLLYAAYARNQGRALDAIMKSVASANDILKRTAIYSDRAQRVA